MRQRQIDRMLLGISAGCFLLMSISFLIMPVESIAILSGLLFWLGLAFGISLQIVLEVRRRAFFRSYGAKWKKMQKPRNGLCSFGSNPAAKITDYVMPVSFVAMVVTVVLTKGYGYVCNVALAVTIFSFCMHCILNGRIYFHAKNQLKIRQALESKKEDTFRKGEGKK